MSDYTVAGYPPQTFEDDGWSMTLHKADTYEFTRWDKVRQQRVKTGEFGVRLVGEFSPGHSSAAKGAILEDVVYQRRNGSMWIVPEVELVAFRPNHDPRGPVGGPHTAVGRMHGKPRVYEPPPGESGEGLTDVCERLYERAAELYQPAFDPTEWAAAVDVAMDEAGERREDVRRALLEPHEPNVYPSRSCPVQAGVVQLGVDEAAAALVDALRREVEAALAKVLGGWQG